MAREPYRCTYCTQTSSRKWNLNIHIQRKHNGMENPFKSASSPHPAVAQFSPSDDGKLSRNNHPRFISRSRHWSERASFAPDINRYLPEDGFNLSSQKGRDSMDYLTEELRQSIEIKNMLNKMKHPINPEPFASNLMPLLISLISTRNSSNLGIFPLLSILNENKKVGIRGHVCHNCLTYWVEILYSNSEELISQIRSTKPIPHSCNPKNVADAHKVQDIENKKRDLENLLHNSLLSLTYLCTLFWSKKPYLKTEELMYPHNYSIDLLLNQSDNPRRENDSVEQQLSRKCWIEGEEVNCNPINISLTSLAEIHWAYRAISDAVRFGKSLLAIDNNEVTDFLKTVKGTFGVLTTDIGDSIRHFFIYISFENE
jgi:hypothetical protein